MSVAYDRDGRGEPLVLIHGLGGERHIWEPTLEHLTGERDVIRVDLPGFGASPTVPKGERATPWVLAAQVAAQLDELGLDRVHVAGNSLGGWVALELAKAGRALSVTGIATAGLWSGPLVRKPYLMRGVAKGLMPVLPLLLAAGGVRRAALLGSVAHPERIPRAAATRIALAYARSPGFVNASENMRANHFTGGDEVHVPVTMAWCEHDRLIARPRTLPFPARETLLAGCGHVPMYDDPRAVAQVILAGSAARSTAATGRSA
ncbi:alpha/beta fold hydrolase [Paraconexibacter antarcticus]|uniref:Alpha/beta fold hydrolase n=1 Tax=Paraconexibacter antarcticus TaxID=2949664 RepID=A0ABY5DUC4_9ACTN|nr:alpha/beta fold hydrolase [Paraconexibacter antarcticus]UTI64245.1 alpha/beta fold hydrolase [Paraconexibacter antarcticus]